MRLFASLARPLVPLLRPTIRLRLTLIYASLFLGSGACLLAFTYLVVAHLIDTYGFSFSAYAQGTKIGVHLPQILQTAEQRQADTEKYQLLVVSGIALAVMAAASAGLGWVMAGRVLRPLRTITATARHISALSLDRRLALHGPDDELKELADTFDGLLGRLQASFAAQRQFIANVSHELRTPLARQRVLTQVALADPDATTGSLRAVHERVLASGAQQERLIEALLTLALSQRGLDRREPFDLAAVTEEALLARQPEAESLGLKVHASLGAAPVSGNPGLTERLVANLVDNAIRHNVTRGRITVATQASQDQAILTVTNSGPVILPEHVNRLFQPFQRMTPARNGHASDRGLGLGLSIVEAIAAAHGAALTARPEPDGGLIIQVSFPAPGHGTPTSKASQADRGYLNSNAKGNNPLPPEDDRQGAGGAERSRLRRPGLAGRGPEGHRRGLADRREEARPQQRQWRWHRRGLVHGQRLLQRHVPRLRHLRVLQPARPDGYRLGQQRGLAQLSHQLQRLRQRLPGRRRRRPGQGDRRRGHLLDHRVAKATPIPDFLIRARLGPCVYMEQ